jgi:hypothetical protein
MASTHKSVKTIRHALIAAATVGTAVVLAGCGSTATPAASTPTPSSSAPAPTSTPAPTTPASSPVHNAQAPAPVPGATNCHAAGLTVAIVEGDGAGMSQNRVNVQFTNKSAKDCTLQGSPGVSFVRENGIQVGEPAKREAKSEGEPLVLAPGRSVKSPLTIVSFGVFDQSKCKPLQTEGLRIYAPGDTAAMFVAQPGEQACSAVGESQMTVGVLAV